MNVEIAKRLFLAADGDGLRHVRLEKPAECVARGFGVAGRCRSHLASIVDQS